MAVGQAADRFAHGKLGVGKHHGGAPSRQLAPPSYAARNGPSTSSYRIVMPVIIDKPATSERERGLIHAQYRRYGWKRCPAA